MLLECYLKNYSIWMFHKITKTNEKQLNFQGSSLELTDHKGLIEGLYFTP